MQINNCKIVKGVIQAVLQTNLADLLKRIE